MLLRRRQALNWGSGALAGAAMAVAHLHASAGAVSVGRAELANPLGEWASNWDFRLDPGLYLVSEKLDGVRAIWDGTSLRFRSGRPMVAPTWFLTSLPPQALDGELWMGRKSFDQVSGAVRKTQPVDTEWSGLRYLVFDAPAPKLPFEARAQRLQTLVDQIKLPWLAAVEQIRVASTAGVQTHLEQVAASGGEGLVLHRLDAPWQPGRTDAVRKLKLQPDDEATVVAQLPGMGKFEGQMGALLMEMPNGKRFALGTGFNAADRVRPPPIGAQVTYRYRDHTPAGLPKFASFLRVRAAE